MLVSQSTDVAVPVWWAYREWRLEEPSGQRPKCRGCVVWTAHTSTVIHWWKHLKADRTPAFSSLPHDAHSTLLRVQAEAEKMTKPFQVGWPRLRQGVSAYHSVS